MPSTAPEHRPGFAGLAKRFQPTEGYGLIGNQVSPIYVRPNRDLTADDVTPWLRERFEAFFHSRSEGSAGGALVHKYTGWSRLGFFAEILPQAKFVHVVRDGRAVANSWMQMRWWGGYDGPRSWLWGDLSSEDAQVWQRSGQSFCTLAGLHWKALVGSFVDASAELDPSRYLELRYEDLVANPQQTLSGLLQFAGLEWNADFERQLGHFKIRASRVDSFRRNLSEHQVEQLEATMRSELQRYRYLDP